MVGRLALTVSAAVVLVAADDGQRRAHAASASCARGSTGAVIGGKKVCLRAGQRCERKRDAAYHRYKFHCHTGRLVSFAAPPPPTPAPPTPPPPLPGTKVDVGGYKLYVDCVGTGSPTVVLEPGSATAGATRPLPGWSVLRTTLAADTRVCAYDRAGLGASDKRPADLAPTGARFADELHGVLTGANITGPYVLVGASYAGLIIPAHVARYPADYAGLVFLDAERPCPTQCAYDAPEPGVFDVGSVSFGDRPVVVLTSALYELDGPDLAGRSSNSMLANAPLSGHNIPGDNPQLVAAAVRLVVDSVRTGARLPACATTTLPSLGARCGSFR